MLGSTALDGVVRGRDTLLHHVENERSVPVDLICIEYLKYSDDLNDNWESESVMHNTYLRIKQKWDKNIEEQTCFVLHIFSFCQLLHSKMAKI